MRSHDHGENPPGKLLSDRLVRGGKFIAPNRGGAERLACRPARRFMRGTGGMRLLVR